MNKQYTKQSKRISIRLSGGPGAPDETMVSLRNPGEHGAPNEAMVPPWNPGERGAPDEAMVPPWNPSERGAPDEAMVLPKAPGDEVSPMNRTATQKGGKQGGKEAMPTHGNGGVWGQGLAIKTTR